MKKPRNAVCQATVESERKGVITIVQCGKPATDVYEHILLGKVHLCKKHFTETQEK